MERVILISDINTELGLNLLKQYYANGDKIIGISTNDNDNSDHNKIDFKEFRPESLEIIPWNRISPVGIKNVLLKGITRFREIHEALILQTISFKYKQFDALSILEIEKSIDKGIKGSCFLIKELLSYLLQQQRGSLSLVSNIHYQDNALGSPLGEMVEASFNALVKSLFRNTRGSAVIINSFESSTIHSDKFSEFIYKTNNEKTNRASGKKFSYHDKKPFLAGIRNA